MMEELLIRVNRTEEGRIVGGASLEELAPLLQDEPEVFLVYDKNVAWVAQKVAAVAGKGRIRGTFGLDTSEDLKTMDTVLGLSRQLLEAGASRKALVLSIGGGITTDMAGFAAGIYKRGIRYANLPTTLLAQVDAAIGGKTGVNLDGYKNMLGVIIQPQFTFLCADVLRTLPARDFRSGLAELVKTFLLADAAAYEDCVRHLTGTNTAESVPGLPTELIWKAAGIKAGIVQRDPYEKGERALLNLGHTFGHAIEHEARQHGDDITHGEAVAMGIILAAEFSENDGVAKRGLAARLRADFACIGLPVDCPYPAECLRAAMRKDKKVQGSGKIRFVLLKDIGAPLIVEREQQHID